MVITSDCNHIIHRVNALILLFCHCHRMISLSLSPILRVVQPVEIRSNSSKMQCLFFCKYVFVKSMTEMVKNECSTIQCMGYRWRM